MLVAQSVRFFSFPWTVAHHGILLCPWNSPGKNTGVSRHSLLQGIFPIQESNLGLPNCRQILYHLSHHRSKNSCSVAQLCPTLCNLMDCNTRGLPVLHHFQSLLKLVAPLSQWCHPTIASSVIPFSSFLQSFSASGSFLMSQLFVSGGQSIGASASASVLPMNIQGWFPLGLTGVISLQSKGLSRNFFSTTIGKQIYIYILCPLYLFIRWWTLRLFHSLGYCK